MQVSLLVAIALSCHLVEDYLISLPITVSYTHRQIICCKLTTVLSRWNENSISHPMISDSTLTHEAVIGNYIFILHFLVLLLVKKTPKEGNEKREQNLLIILSWGKWKILFMEIIRRHFSLPLYQSRRWYSDIVIFCFLKDVPSVCNSVTRLCNTNVNEKMLVEIFDDRTDSLIVWRINENVTVDKVLIREGKQGLRHISHGLRNHDSVTDSTLDKTSRLFFLIFPIDNVIGWRHQHSQEVTGSEFLLQIGNHHIF